MAKTSARIYAMCLRSVIHYRNSTDTSQKLIRELTSVSSTSLVDKGLSCWIVGEICDVAIDGHFNDLVDRIDGDYEPLGGIVDLSIVAHLAEVEAYIGENTVD